jgi:hypothetical protein
MFGLVSCGGPVTPVSRQKNSWARTLRAGADFYANRGFLTTENRRAARNSREFDSAKSLHMMRNRGVVTIATKYTKEGS